MAWPAPIFSWTVHQPDNPAPSDRARDTLVELLDEFYERKDHPEVESAEPRWRRALRHVAPGA